MTWGIEVDSAPIIANLEAEAAVLGACLMENSLVDALSAIVEAGDFFAAAHGRIWSAILIEQAKGRAFTSVSLKPYLDGDEGLKELGGWGYIARLTANIHGLLAPRELAQQVRDLADRRRMHSALSEVMAALPDSNRPLVEIAADADAAIAARASEGFDEADAETAMIAALDALDRGIEGVECRTIPAVDELCGPLEPKSLTIVAGRPGMGKTAFSSSYALGAARSGHGVLFVSLEMSRDQLAHRMLADVAFDDADNRVPYSAIQKRNLSRWQRETVNAVAKYIAGLPLHIVDAAAMTVGRLDALVRSHKRKMAARGQKLDLVIVDYLQLLHPTSRKASTYEAISEVSRMLKQIAKAHDVAVMALAQLSRSVEQRPDKRPMLSDLRDSGQIEQDADAVLFLYREEYYVMQAEPRDDPDKHDDWQARMDRCRGIIDFILPKRRNGSAGAAQGRFYGVYQAVRS
ncbi:MAG: DnaB-like helicase C-terminal domain-containing protein [Novosphingobium aromaticivorans]|nr:DnaB-like helicase C-terminal domain-containing protein [Novosphingobium aromaticivorans]